jgi:aspartate aminotransferase
MGLLSDRINNLSESETLAMSRISNELKCQGIDVINLSIGEPDFPTPDFIKDAAKKALDENWTHYTPVPGYADLRKAICEKLKRDNNLDYLPEQIVVSTGAKHSIANAMLCLVNPGDEVIVPTPYWVSYKEIVKIAEGKAVYITGGIENDFKVTPQQIEKAITKKTKVFIFSSPCNPSGSLYSYEELVEIAKVFEKHPEIIIISDEIYELINFTGKHASIASYAPIKDRVVVVNGLSKGYAMTGWRLGYIAANKAIAEACNKLQGQFTSGTNSIAQRAAITAMKADPKVTNDMVSKFRERRDLLLKLLKDVPGIKTNTPQGAFYVFPDVTYYYGKSNGETKINDSNDLCMYLLYNAHVALVGGGAFGDDNCIRISYATSNELLIESVSRIKKALAELK